MHEDLLRHLWAKQLFHTERLVTISGQAVRIIDPGKLHRGSGPDFRDAVIDIHGIVYRGDIEFHRTIYDWELHHHSTDPAYNSVILHVVLKEGGRDPVTESGRVVPTIVLDHYLHTTLGRLVDHLAREEAAERNSLIPCAVKNHAFPVPELQDWIHKLYRDRLSEKIRIMYDRLSQIIIEVQRTIREPQQRYHDMIDEEFIPLPHQTIDPEAVRQRLPWEQLLYENIMDVLGYSQNRIPMKRLAEAVPIMHLLSLMTSSNAEPCGPQTPLVLQGLLFKASGLLPETKSVSDQQSKVMVHQLRSTLREITFPHTIPSLDPTEWVFSPTRPSNFPTIRIAAAGHLVHKILCGSLFRSIITIIGGQFSAPESKIAQLRTLFACCEDPFWSCHYSFEEASPRTHVILGNSRINDLVMNTVVPFTCLYSQVFGKKEVFEHCLSLAAVFPVLEENAILRKMKKQLVRNSLPISTAFQQQGLIQLYKKYCTQKRCKECSMGKLAEIQP